MRTESQPVNYETLAAQYGRIRQQADILSGDELGDSGSTWRDHAHIMANELRVLASMLDRAAMGDAGPAIVFPPALFLAHDGE